MKKYQSFLSETFHFLVVKFSVYLNRRVFVMDKTNLPYETTDIQRRTAIDILLESREWGE